MVHDRIAEELEAKGFYRRAAARWGEVMQLVETDKERHQVTMRRLECSRKAQKPPEPSIGSLVRSYLLAALGMHKNYGGE
ncbi:PerC family transcriptional regulator [Escherichia coli]|nr:PerC family transcriptional regulator [Escherichia coli]EFL6124342.1 PerC family transcriptional regulator [Escherichia coli]